MIALVVAALVAGCGGEEKDPFGDVSRADRTRATDVSNHIGRFSFENEDWLAAANKGNVKRARREFDRASEDYVAAGSRLMEAAERKVPPDRATEDRLVTDVDEAAQRVRREEQDFRKALEARTE